MAEIKDMPSDGAGDGDDGGFARRWSRLKQENRVQEKQENRVQEACVPADESAAEPDGDAAVQPIDPADLPDVDSLDADSDFTPFMRQGVPDDIKNLALRKLWRSNAVFANLDGLNEYDEDFGAIMKAGQGFMEQLAEAAKAAADNGTDGPRYPTATYAAVEADAANDDGEPEEMAENHPHDAVEDTKKTAGAGDDGDDHTA